MKIVSRHSGVIRITGLMVGRIQTAQSRKSDYYQMPSQQRLRLHQHRSLRSLRKQWSQSRLRRHLNI